MEPTRDRARFCYAIIDQLGNLFDVLHIDHTMFPQARRHRPRHEGDRGKMLTQAIVQFLANAPLLAVTDFENLALQSARSLFQESLSTLSVANIADYRHGCLDSAFGVVRRRGTDTYPENGSILSNVTLLGLIGLTFPHQTPEQPSRFSTIILVGDVADSPADEIGFLIAEHLAHA